MPFIDASGMKINFPYDPYPCQVDYMEKVVQSLQTGNNAILESPTGTGKTLCLLCACLAWLENKKAQIGNIRWKAENAGHEMPDFMKENVSSDYRNELTKMLDTAAGSWNGEMGAPKIIYASRTHSQLNQAMQEFKKTSYRYLKACVIGSREQLCIHSQVAKETNNTTKVHLCRSKVSSRSCHFFNNVETFKTQVVDQVLDIEDLVGLGQKNNVCPYYLTRELKKDADLIFMPYNYLLDPKSRKAHGVELQGNILIFDEAHNLERICEESASFDFSSSDLASAISDINRIIQKVQEWQSTEISASADSESPAVFDYSMEDVLAYKSCLLKFEEQIDCIPVSGEGETYPGEKIFEILSEVGLTLSTKSAFQELTDKMISTLANDATNAVFSSRGGGLAKFGDVMQVVFTREPPEKMDFKSYIGIVSKHYKVHLKVEAPRIKKKVEVWTENVPQSKMGRVLSYWCFNPGYTMADLRNNGVKLIILTSGTLSPLTSFISEFGIDFPVRLENSHVITQKQVSIGSLEKSPDNKLLSSAYENRFRGEYLEGLAYTIINFAKIIPKGVLVFFPSYPVMEKSLEHWKTCGLRDRLEALKPIFVEPKSKSEFSLAMLGFYEKIRDSAGAIFMAVCRGKVSEGLDFADNNGRGVIITGLPYPPRMDARVKLKMQFLDETRKTSNTGLSGQDWYVQQASRAVNQAIGRVIRHKNDFGVILLCDARFSKFRQQLPLWLRSVMKVHQNFGAAQLEVKQFFKNFDSELDHTSSIVTTKCVQSNDNFSVGSSFEIIGGKNNKVLKASAVVNHYASLCDDNYPEDFLAQYSRPAKVPAQPVQSKKGLLSALNAAEESTSSKLTKAQDSLQTSTKNHIFSKSKNSTEIQIKNRRALLLPSINSYLQEIRKVFSNETYCEFKQVLSDYRVDHDVNKLLEKLERLFDILEPNNLFIIVGLCKFIRPSDRGTFKELCSNIIGPSFEEALGPSLPEEKEVDDPVKSPPNKRLKLEHCTNKSTCQTTMMDHFIKKDTEKASLTVQGHIKSSHSSVNMDSKSHLQTGSHLSSQGLKLQSKLTSKSPEKPKNVKLQSTKEMTSTTTCLKNEMAITPKKCPLCDIVHEGPLAKSSVCGHSCCRICWEKALKSTKSCTFCGSKLKRKYLQLGYFLS